MNRENIKSQNSVIVSGITLSDLNQELEACLQKYGPIKRNMLIDNPESEYHHSANVEFVCESARSNLESSLPIKIQSTQDADVVFHVCSLGSAYASAVSSSAT